MTAKTTPGKAVGEVVSASITGFTAELWQEQDEDGLPRADSPHFGSFLRADSADHDMSILAVVYDVRTGPQDNLHRPHALGLSRQQLRSEQPQIFALLKTEVHAATVGFSASGRHFTRLPPQPPQVHDFVYRAQKEEIIAVSEDLDFLRLLYGLSAVPVDELVAAAVRHACLAREDGSDFLLSAGQAITQYCRDDYDRLVAILKKIRPQSQ